jgi:DNA-binding transcriptional MerR regulator
MKDLLTTLDAARRLGRSVDRVRDYEREGKLPAQRTVSGQRLFRAGDVDRLATQLRSKAKKEASNER